MAKQKQANATVSAPQSVEPTPGAYDAVEQMCVVPTQSMEVETPFIDAAANEVGAHAPVGAAQESNGASNEASPAWSERSIGEGIKGCVDQGLVPRIEDSGVTCETEHESESRRLRELGARYTKDNIDKPAMKSGGKAPRFKSEREYKAWVFENDKQRFMQEYPGEVAERTKELVNSGWAGGASYALNKACGMDDLQNQEYAVKVGRIVDGLTSPGRSQPGPIGNYGQKSSDVKIAQPHHREISRTSPEARGMRQPPNNKSHKQRKPKPRRRR